METQLTDGQRAHFVLRATLGLNLLAHGLVRAPHALAFADKLTQDFATTLLPAILVRPFATILPFLELGVGIAVLLGFRLRAALGVGGLSIAMLTFGICLQQAWEIAGFQLVYALAYWVLASRAADARFTVDALLARRAAEVRDAAA
jgi:thiosulfate dehydrogenase [quinone] large subunit